jgi:PAS domain-containing protein
MAASEQTIVDIGDRLVSQLQTFHQRVQRLRIEARSKRAEWVLEQALDELSLAVDLVNSAAQQLNRQSAAHLDERAELEEQYRHYYQLYADAPVAYLMTTLDGTIRQANAQAVALLRTSERSLIGRALTNFIPEGRRRAFRAQIAGVPAEPGAHEWVCALQPPDHPEIPARIAAKAARGPGSRPIGIRWIILPIAGETDAGVAARAAPLEIGLEGTRFAVLAEASALLAVAQQPLNLAGHVARLLTEELAACCAIELFDPRAQVIRQVLVMRPQERGRAAVHEFRQEYPASDLKRWEAARAAGLTDEPDLAARALFGAAPAEAEARRLLADLGASACLVARANSGEAQVAVLLAAHVTQRAFEEADLLLTEELARRVAAMLARASQRVAG